MAMQVIIKASKWVVGAAGAAGRTVSAANSGLMYKKGVEKLNGAWMRLNKTNQGASLLLEVFFCKNKVSYR